MDGEKKEVLQLKKMRPRYKNNKSSGRKRQHEVLLLWILPHERFMYAF